MKRILIVDDKEENRYLLHVLLNGNGFEVDEARHGAEALVRARQNQPQLVISDLLMPVMDGYTLLRHWKMDEQLKQVPFVVYTATYTEPKDERLALSLGADAFIIKPTEPESFMDRIQEVLSKQDSGLLSPINLPAGDEKDQYQVYSEVLIRKLEEKALQLEEANHALEHDIEVRKHVEEALRDSERRLQEAQRIAKMGDFTWDVKTGTVTWSSGLYDLLGYDKSEVIDYEKIQNNIYHPEDLDRVAAWINDAIASGSDELPQNEFRILCKNGDVLTILAVGKVYRRAGKKPEIFATIQDITERKRYEAELERLTAAINQAGESVVITDAAGIIQYVNPAFEDVSGFSKQEVIGQSSSFLKSDQHDSSFYNQIWQTISSGRIWSGRIVNKNKKGTLYTENATISPVRDASGKIVNYVAVKQDITGHLQLEAQYQQAQKMESVGRLAGGVAHDYNNFLSVIISYAELALVKMKAGDPFYNNLKQIYSAAEHSRDITRQLLAFARKETIRPEVLDLNATVESMLKILRQLIGEEVNLIWLPGKSLKLVFMDPSQIDQIMANLCINARDAIANIGKITIETGTAVFDSAYCADHIGYTPGEFVMLTVSDDGCGIDRETLNMIFEPFFTTKKIGKGTGLGLATVYGIVKQNEGFINVYSEPGQGTTFKIYLPRYTGEVTAQQPVDAGKVPQGNEETVLVVEDETSILHLTENILTDLNYKVITANTPSAAIELAKANCDKIVLLVTDVIMPEMSGRELAEQIMIICPKIKCLYMSGYPEDVIAHRGVLDKGVRFIQKPFSFRDLAVNIRNTIEEK